MILNKCPTSPKPVLVETVRRKTRKVAKTRNVISEAPLEILKIDNSEYQIEIIETEFAEEGDGQIYEFPQFEVISEEQIDLKPEMKKEQPQTYCNILRDDENPELDENNEKKIFKCSFKGCSETFSRRQQCKTHFYNHLATDSNFTCKYCEKKFKVGSALERHERVHTNSKVRKI